MGSKKNCSRDLLAFLFFFSHRKVWCDDEKKSYHIFFWGKGRLVPVHIYIYLIHIYMYTYIYTYIRVSPYSTSLPPSLPLSLVAYILLRYPYPTRYPHWPIPSKFKQKVHKVSSRQPARQNYNSIDRQLLLVVPKTY